MSNFKNILYRFFKRETNNVEITTIPQPDTSSLSNRQKQALSRQLYVVGEEAQRKISQCNVLISGMGGTGIEVAKNIILAGVKSVVIHDMKNTSFCDLSSQFYLNENAIGSNRAIKTLKMLEQLNTNVDVKAYTGKLTQDYLKAFHIVVLTDNSFEEQKLIGDFCHKNNTKFIVGETRGLFGKIFCDFGDRFEIFDADGRDPNVSFISEIQKDDDGIVHIRTIEPHEFTDYDYVKLTCLDCMPELNEKEFKIEMISRSEITIENINYNSKYTSGGNLIFVRKPKYMSFKSYSEACLKPEYCDSDPRKIKNLNTCHIGFEALHEFCKLNGGSLPKSWDKADAEKFLELIKNLNKNKTEPFTDLNTKLLLILVCIARGNLCPIQSIIGGIAAQEVIKACSGKFNPICQFFYYDAIDCLPDDLLENDVINYDFYKNLCNEFKDSRYEGQIMVFGTEFQKRLENLNCFLVGAGAIGCEYLKNFAMMGVSCGKGSITVTDMDSIELSNLNRQFLFRNSDIGKFKSSVAAKAVKQMNQSIKIRDHIYEVSEETQSVYDDEFFQSLDCVLTALDNVKARKYIDSRCLYYKKPMIDSGTQGTKASVQVILPYLSQSYNASHQDDGEPKAIPLCTLKQFPKNISHTLQWAKEIFAEKFNIIVGWCMNYAKNPSNFIDNVNSKKTLNELEELKKLQALYEIFRIYGIHDFDSCVHFARCEFDANFKELIKKLISMYPKDYKTENGELMWTGDKRFPNIIDFNINENLHFEFVKATATLMAKAFNITISPNIDMKEEIKRILNKVDVNNYKTAKESLINMTIEELLDEIKKENNLKQFEQLNPIEFEKDDDLHIDFITACSNLRATNYSIPIVDRLKSKLIAGRIIPAIATTTSVVVGLDCVELYKIIQNHKNLLRFKNTNFDLKEPYFNFTKPQKPAISKSADKEYSEWDDDETVFKQEVTLNELLFHFENERGFKVSHIYSERFKRKMPFIHRAAKPDESMNNLKISEIIEKKMKTKIPVDVKIDRLIITCVDKNGKLYTISPVKYFFYEQICTCNII